MRIDSTHTQHFFQQMFIVILYIALTIVFVYCLFTVGVLWHWHTYRTNKVRKASTQDKERRAEKAFIYPTIDILIAVRNETQLYHTIESLINKTILKIAFASYLSMISQMRMNPYLYSTELSMSWPIPLRLFAYATSYPHRLLIYPIRSAP